MKKSSFIPFFNILFLLISIQAFCMPPVFREQSAEEIEAEMEDFLAECFGKVMAEKNSIEADMFDALRANDDKKLSRLISRAKRTGYSIDWSVVPRRPVVERTRDYHPLLPSAIAIQKAELVRILVEEGKADVNLPFFQGEVPLKVAFFPSQERRQPAHYEIAQILLRNGAKIGPLLTSIPYFLRQLKTSNPDPTRLKLLVDLLRNYDYKSELASFITELQV